VEGGLILDVVVGEHAAVLELLSSEEEALLLRGNALPILGFCLDVVDRFEGLNLHRAMVSAVGFLTRNCITSQCGAQGGRKILSGLGGRLL